MSRLERPREEAPEEGGPRQGRQPALNPPAGGVQSRVSCPSLLSRAGRRPPGSPQKQPGPRPIPPPLPGLHPPPWAKQDPTRVPAFTPQSPPHRQHPLPGYCHPAPRCHLLKEPSTAPRLPGPPISSEQAFPLTVCLPMGMSRLISRALGHGLAGRPPGPEGRLLPSSLARGSALGARGQCSGGSGREGPP